MSTVFGASMTLIFFAFEKNAAVASTVGSGWIGDRRWGVRWAKRMCGDDIISVCRLPKGIFKYVKVLSIHVPTTL